MQGMGQQYLPKCELGQDIWKTLLMYWLTYFWASLLTHDWGSRVCASINISRGNIKRGYSTPENECGAFLMLACNKENKTTALFKEGRTATDTEDKEEMDQWRRWTSTRRQRRRHPKRWTKRWTLDGIFLFNAFMYLAT